MNSAFFSQMGGRFEDLPVIEILYWLWEATIYALNYPETHSVSEMGIIPFVLEFTVYMVAQFGTFGIVYILLIPALSFIAMVTIVVVGVAIMGVVTHTALILARAIGGVRRG